jgi:DNA invertase Pin-like site-specific DNA recombinase
MRAAIYARYSTDLQRKESIDDQFRACARLAAAQGFTVVYKLYDEAISGGTAGRPGYQSLLEAARRHEIEVVVVEDLSRLWRNRATYGQDSAELEDLNVHLITCVGDDTRRDGYGLVLGIKSAIAEHQRR